MFKQTLKLAKLVQQMKVNKVQYGLHLDQLSAYGITLRKDKAVEILEQAGMRRQEHKLLGVLYFVA